MKSFEWSELVVKKNIPKLLFIRAIVAILMGLWTLGIFIPVLVNDIGVEHSILPFINHSYSLVCHQDADKSFLINNKKIFVCSRCTGIYSGAFISSLFLLFSLKRFNPKKAYLWIAPLPMLIDVLSNFFGLYSHNKIISLSTGLFFGSILFIYISDVLETTTTKD